MLYRLCRNVLHYERFRTQCVGTFYMRTHGTREDIFCETLYKSVSVLSLSILQHSSDLVLVPTFIFADSGGREKWSLANNGEKAVAEERGVGAFMYDVLQNFQIFFTPCPLPCTENQLIVLLSSAITDVLYACPQ